ncbi:hypothetical protein C4D60_Mb09t14690 [Musa balbisiana]|uniref:Uncharacterized protein n=1 Tax=Musa balbisiana TaxID=52838 RepID=A0A4S8IIY4_MUSBA|nr:hypothetical protein C4D60_Mb09t14690 [Musa balbisiana]
MYHPALVRVSTSSSHRRPNVLLATTAVLPDPVTISLRKRCVRSSPWSCFRVSAGALGRRSSSSSSLRRIVTANLGFDNEPGDGKVEDARAGDVKGLSSDIRDRKNGKKSLKAFSPNEFYIAPAPGKMGYAAAVERFLKLLATIWAGSQVTKIVRAGGALALAPFVDRGLSWFTVKFKFESKGQAFAAIAGLCFGLVLLLFFVLTLLWA